MAARAALHFGFEICQPPDEDNPLGGYPIMPNDWRVFGRGAGHARNRIMLVDGLPDRVIAFDLGTPGTKDMLDQAAECGVPCEVWRPSSRSTRSNTARRLGRVGRVVVPDAQLASRLAHVRPSIPPQPEYLETQREGVLVESLLPGF